jgi:hypothetical protein
MPLPVVNGSSWLTGTLNSPPVQLTLPVPEVVRYSAKLGDYAVCGISSHYKVDVVPIATASLRVVKRNDEIALEWVLTNTVVPGLIDTINYEYRENLEFELAGVTFHYALAATTESREGLYVNQVTGSAVLSLETGSVIGGQFRKGDAWVGPDGVLRVIDTNLNGGLYTSSILTARYSPLSATVGKVEQGLGKSISLGINNLYSRGFVTVNSPTSIGRGFRNLDWNGGLYMLDSGTVAVWGGHGFRVPSGSLRVWNTVLVDNFPTPIRLNRGDVIIHSGSLGINGFLQAVQLRGLGVSSSIFINGKSVAVLYDRTGSFDDSSGAFAADWYLYRGESVYMYVRANNDWYTLISSSLFYPQIDGGVF